MLFIGDVVGKNILLFKKEELPTVLKNSDSENTENKYQDNSMKEAA